ncbi:MAG TPA: amino acid ABC transporter permease [Thermomicrobiales bacterium]
MEVVWESRELLWQGLEYTLRLFAVVIVLGTAIGILGGVGLLYGHAIIRALLRAYVDIIRGMPLIVTIFILFYGPVAYGINLSSFQSIALALAIFAGAHMSEIVRGAIATIPRGQIDAAKSLGLTFWPRLFSIVLPQALPLMIPPWTNLAVDIFKGTSLAVLVSQADFLFSVQKRASARGHYLAFYMSAMVVYFVCCFAISRAGAWLSRRTRIGLA